MSAQVAARPLRAHWPVWYDTGTRNAGARRLCDSDQTPFRSAASTGTATTDLCLFGPGHRWSGLAPVDRTATFVFFLGAGCTAGDRFWTMTYHFTHARLPSR